MALNGDEEEEDFEVERILAEKTIDGCDKFLVKWKGYPDHECTWEPAENFNFPETLQLWKKQKMNGDILEGDDLHRIQQQMDAFQAGKFTEDVDRSSSTEGQSDLEEFAYPSSKRPKMVHDPPPLSTKSRRAIHDAPTTSGKKKKPVASKRLRSHKTDGPDATDPSYKTMKSDKTPLHVPQPIALSSDGLDPSRSGRSSKSAKKTEGTAPKAIAPTRVDKFTDHKPPKKFYAPELSQKRRKSSTEKRTQRAPPSFMISVNSSSVGNNKRPQEVVPGTPDQKPKTQASSEAIELPHDIEANDSSFFFSEESDVDAKNKVKGPECLDPVNFEATVQDHGLQSENVTYSPRLGSRIYPEIADIVLQPSQSTCQKSVHEPSTLSDVFNDQADSHTKGKELKALVALSVSKNSTDNHAKSNTSCDEKINNHYTEDSPSHRPNVGDMDIAKNRQDATGINGFPILSRNLRELSALPYSRISTIDYNDVRVLIVCNEADHEQAKNVQSLFARQNSDTDGVLLQPVETRLTDQDDANWRKFKLYLKTSVCVLLCGSACPINRFDGLGKMIEHDNLLCWQVDLASREMVLKATRLFPVGYAVAISQDCYLNEPDHVIYILRWLKKRVQQGSSPVKLLLPPNILTTIQEHAVLSSYSETQQLFLQLAAVIEELFTVSTKPNARHVYDMGFSIMLPQWEDVYTISPNMGYVPPIEQRKRDRVMSDAFLNYFGTWALQNLTNYRRFMGFLLATKPQGNEHVRFSHCKTFVESDRVAAKQRDRARSLSRDPSKAQEQGQTI